MRQQILFPNSKKRSGNGQLPKGAVKMNSNTVICACNGVTAGQIEKAVQSGARTFEDVQQVLHIGRQCIKCRDMAEF